MPVLPRLVAAIDRWTDWSGRALAWLAAILVIVTCAVVIARYGFQQGSIAMQESMTYLHATLFLLGAAYALKQSAHVRVDIFYRNFSPRTRAWIDSLGTVVFLLPLCVFIVAISWDFVAAGWAIRERSAEPGGLPFVYLLKTLISLMAVNLAVQGVAELGRNLLLLTAVDQPETETHH